MNKEKLFFNTLVNPDLNIGLEIHNKVLDDIPLILSLPKPQPNSIVLPKKLEVPLISVSIPTETQLNQYELRELITKLINL